MSNLEAIRAQARRHIATEGRVLALELIKYLEPEDQVLALETIADVLREHLRRIKKSAGGTNAA